MGEELSAGLPHQINWKDAYTHQKTRVLQTRALKLRKKHIYFGIIFFINLQLVSFLK
jgi:hypothetical protein